MGLHWPDHSWDVSSDFPFLFFWDGFMVIFHGVNLLRRVVKIDSIGTFVATGAGLLVLVCMLRREILGLLFKDFTTLWRVPRDMQQACIFRTGRSITWMACIVFLVLDSTVLLGVGGQDGCSSIFIPTITGTVGLFQLIIFGRCSSFIYCLQYFHALEHITCLLAGPPFKIPSLYVGLFCPRVGDSVKDNLVQLFSVHFIGDAWSRENRKVVIQFR